MRRSDGLPIQLSDVEPLPIDKSVDQIVEHLLRDQDFLLAKEIKHKVDELNQLLVRAQGQKLKVEVDVSHLDLKSGGSVAHVDVRLYKQL